MPSESKPAVPAKDATTVSPRLAALKAREKNLQRKIKERIPTFPENTREESLARAQGHLATVQAAIKTESKS